MDLIKVGVNFPITRPTLEACAEINKAMMALTESAVTFGVEGNSEPHVTVAMGTLERAKIDYLRTVVEKESLELPGPFMAEFGRPYRESLTGRYVVCDVVLSEAVRRWRLNLQDGLSRFFADVARVSDEPHLTLAHVDENLDCVDSYLKGCPSLPSCEVDRVALSLAGNKGRKLKTLAEVPLG